VALASDRLDELTGLLTDLTDEIESTAQDTVSASRSMILGFATLALIASGLIGYLVTRSIRKPLHETVNTIKEIATGDLRKSFNVSGNDELGMLARSMQDLVTQLRGMVQEISSNSEQLAATAEESAAISEQSFAAVYRQKEQTELVATAIEEMTATVEEVARNIHNTLTQVESAHSEVQDGQRVLNENIASIKHLAEDINQAATVIECLNDDSANIGTVLDVIRSVAEQTNLLALNAAIEAARAGEQGRGFAVVADEVRTLASRTNASTTEIQEMIHKLQTGAREAVDTMTRSREEAQRSVSGIAQAGTMLQSIASAITTIKDMSHQIASASEEQSSTTQEQHRNIVAIAETSEQTAQGAQENQTASQELARMAEMQRTLIAKFKV
jgi:methyl-accepting chemotaxis protein